MANLVEAINIDRDICQPLTETSLKKLRETKRLREEKKAERERESKAKEVIIQSISGSTSQKKEEAELKPDISLEDGQELPQGKFPKQFINCALEDLDPYYHQHGIETFCVISKRFGKKYVHRFSATNALYIFSPFNFLRYWSIRTILHPLFDAFILSVILINCVFLALDNEMASAEYVFTAIYTVEMVIKMIARGLILHPFSYFRDPWNWLDFVVVILAYATFAGSANVSGLRALRVLRAFKSVSIVPGLKIIVNSIFHSLKPLGEVFLIMFFLVIVVALVALQAYAGVLRRRCVRVPSPDVITSDAAWYNYVRDSANWNPVEEEEEVVCGNSSGSGFCPTNFVCLDGVAENPNYGFTNFDHMGFSMLTSFQLISLDFWENVYNLIIRAEGPWNILFFLMSVFLGPFYLLNLLLAVITLAYCKEVDREAELKEKRLSVQQLHEKLKKRKKQLQYQKIHAPANSVLPYPQNETSITIENTKALEQQTDMEPNAAKAAQKRRASTEERRAMFKSNQKHASMDSSSSTSSKHSGLQYKLELFLFWFQEVFCCWKCSLCFRDFQTVLKIVIEHKSFEYIVMFCIIANTIFLAIDHYGISPQLLSALNIGNTVFTIIFSIEALIKIFGLGPIKYVKDPWNDFDFIIVLISLIELFLELSGNATGFGLTVLRTLRLLRVFRLARMWGTMHKLVKIIWKTIGAVGYLTVVLFLILFIFAVIGKQLYGARYAESASKFDDNRVPRWNFVDFYHSFLLVWRVMCGEWIEPLHDCLHLTGGDGGCVALFLIVFLVANFMVLNLFTAILLAAFNVDEIAKMKKEKIKERKEKQLALMIISAFRKSVKDQSSNAVAPMPSQEVVGTGTGKNVSSETPGSNKSLPTNVYQLTQALRAKKKRKGAAAPKKSNSVQKNFNEMELPETAAKKWKETVAEKRKEKPREKTEIAGTETAEMELHSNAPEHPLQSQNNFKPRNGDSSFVIANTNAIWPENESNVVLHDSGKLNGGPQHSQVSLRRANQDHVRFCSSFYCCCYIPEDEYEESTVTSTASSPQISKATTKTNNSLLNETAAEEDTETVAEEDTETVAEEDTETAVETMVMPPNCLPLRLLDRYPLLSYTPKNQVYKYWMFIRKACFNLVSHSYFEWFILLLILASTICLAMEDAYLDSDPSRKQVLQKLEYVFTALFTLEMLLKWVGLGLTDYFTSVWCLLDCGIVAVSWAGIILEATNQASETGAFRSLRTLRALRPLRAVSRWEGMRVVVNSLIYCIPSIGNVLCVCLLIWLVFGIMGVQLFKGKFFRCVDESGERVEDPAITSRTLCIQNNLTWINPNINFDNVIIAMVALFQVATYEGWIEVMSDANDVVDVDMQPRHENSQYNIIFFVVFILLGAFFILNLFVGVIIESFQKLRKQTSSSMESLMTESQKKFYKTMKAMLNKKPKEIIPPPTNRIQLLLFKLVTHTRFEIAIFIIICLNMLALSMEHYQMTQEWIDSLRVVDIVFTGLFSVEATIKIIGLREFYFKDAFNAFDFLVVLVSIAGFILESVITLSVSPTLLRIVRVFRVFRVLRVIRAARGIRRLILTLLTSIPALFNIAVLLSVFMVIFAILGMNSFMNVRLTGALNDQVNFKTFANAMFLLFRLATSAGWNDVLDPLMNTRDCTPSDGVNVGDCGDPVLAVIYFVAFIFLAFLVIVNMYIAIILDNFDDILQQDESGISLGDFEEFYSVWAGYDPKATQFVTLQKLSNLLDDLKPPFQIPKPNEIKISALELPVLPGDKVHCLDVLFALVKRILGDVEIPPELKEEAENLLDKYFPNRKQLEATTTTLILRQQIRSAKLIQQQWRSILERRKNPESQKPAAFSDFMSKLLTSERRSSVEPPSHVPGPSLVAELNNSSSKAVPKQEERKVAEKKTKQESPKTKEEKPNEATEPKKENEPRPSFAFAPSRKAAGDEIETIPLVIKNPSVEEEQVKVQSRPKTVATSISIPTAPDPVERPASAGALSSEKKASSNSAKVFPQNETTLRHNALLQNFVHETSPKLNQAKSDQKSDISPTNVSNINDNTGV